MFGATTTLTFSYSIDGFLASRSKRLRRPYSVPQRAMGLRSDRSTTQRSFLWLNYSSTTLRRDPVARPAPRGAAYSMPSASSPLVGVGGAQRWSGRGSSWAAEQPSCQASVTYGYAERGRIKDRALRNNSCVVYGYDLAGRTCGRADQLSARHNRRFRCGDRLTWGTYSFKEPRRKANCGRRDLGMRAMVAVIAPRCRRGLLDRAPIIGLVIGLVYSLRRPARRRPVRGASSATTAIEDTHLPEVLIATARHRRQRMASWRRRDCRPSRRDPRPTIRRPERVPGTASELRLGLALLTESRDIYLQYGYFSKAIDAWAMPRQRQGCLRSSRRCACGSAAGSLALLEAIRPDRPAQGASVELKAIPSPAQRDFGRSRRLGMALGPARPPRHLQLRPDRVAAAAPCMKVSTQQRP